MSYILLQNDTSSRQVDTRDDKILLSSSFGFESKQILLGCLRFEDVTLTLNNFRGNYLSRKE